MPHCSRRHLCLAARRAELLGNKTCEIGDITVLADGIELELK
jgi:hypothetical protein